VLSSGISGAQLEPLLIDIEEGDVVQVTPRGKDTTFWELASLMFGESTVCIQGRNLPLRQAEALCKSPLVDAPPFEMLFVTVVRQSFRLWGPRAVRRFIGKLATLPTKVEVRAAVLTAQMLLAFEPRSMPRYLMEVSLRKVAKRFKVRLIPRTIPVRLSYNQRIGRAAITRAVASVIADTGCRGALAKFMASRVSVVRRSRGSVFPKWYTHRKWLQRFDETPPECSGRCKGDCRVPRRDGCYVGTPAEMPHLRRRLRVLRFHQKATPFPVSSSVRTVIVAALTDLTQTLANLCETPLTSQQSVKALAEACVIAPPYGKTQLAAFTSRDEQKAMSVLASEFVVPTDKNIGTPTIMCPRLAWMLTMQAFEWRGDDPPFKRVADKTVDQILGEVKASYPFAALVPLKGDQLALGEAWPKYYPLAKHAAKFKARPLCRTFGEPHSRVKKMATRAAYAIFNAVVKTRSPHTAQVMDVRERLDLMLVSSKKKARQADAEADWVFQTVSDDVEGCYGALDPAEALVWWHRFVKLATDTLKRSERSCYVGAPSEHVSLANVPPYRRPERAILFDLDTITRIIEWSIQFRYIKLGKLILWQCNGLFQGCPLSVILTLVALTMSELSAPSPMVRSLRYVDDKLSVITLRRAEWSPARVQMESARYNERYAQGLKILPEDRFVEGAWLFLGVLVFDQYINSKGGGFQCAALIKNATYRAMSLKGSLRAQHLSQIFVAEIPWSSYIPRAELRGQRYGRLAALLVLSDESFRYSVVLTKVKEYVCALNDPPASMVQVLARIQSRFPDTELGPVFTWLRAFRQSQENRRVHS